MGKLDKKAKVKIQFALCNASAADVKIIKRFGEKKNGKLKKGFKYGVDSKSCAPKCSAGKVTTFNAETTVARVNWLQNQFSKNKITQEVSCADELRAREFISTLFEPREKDANGPSMGIGAGTNLIRMVFHDAVDHNNLMFANGTLTPHDQSGGVDFCLHTSLLAQGKTGSESATSPAGEPNHNRGLNHARRVVMKISRKRDLGIRYKFSAPDIEVLGALVAIEGWFDGPKIGYQSGRKKGPCKKPFCVNDKCRTGETHFLASPVAEPLPHGNFDIESLLKAFTKSLGTSDTESVALMGAHTVGGINACTGMGRVHKRTWCEQCKHPTKGDFLEAKKGERQNIDDLGFMTVGYFDSTPGTFDNDLWKDLAQNTFEKLPQCQLTSDRYAKRYKSKWWKKKNPKAAPPIETCLSTVKWCNASNPKDHRKSKIINMFQWGKFKGQSKRLVRLPAFWALLSNTKTKAEVAAYAKDEKKFHTDFASAYHKVINTGYSSLDTCSPVSCSISKGKIICAASGVTVTFTGSDCVCDGKACKPPAKGPCTLVGGFGMRGELKCGTWTGACASSMGTERTSAAAQQKKTWSTGAGGCPLGSQDPGIKGFEIKKFEAKIKTAQDDIKGYQSEITKPKK
jgi:hypothetical protein